MGNSVAIDGVEEVGSDLPKTASRFLTKEYSIQILMT
jgi:hypothetical protein